MISQERKEEILKGLKDGTILNEDTSITFDENGNWNRNYLDMSVSAKDLALPRNEIEEALFLERFERVTIPYFERRLLCKNPLPLQEMFESYDPDYDGSNSEIFVERKDLNDMTIEELRKIYNDYSILEDDLPVPKTTYERALFRKRVSVQYGLMDDCIFDCPTMNRYFLPTDEEKRIYYTLDEELRDNRNYQDLSIDFDDLAYPRTITEYSIYYQRLITSDDSEFKEYIMNDIEYFEMSFDDGYTFDDLYSDCFDQFRDFSEQKYVALRIAYLKKEGYIS